MGNFNTTTIMLLKEDIAFKQENAAELMTSDIRNAIKSRSVNAITLRNPFGNDGVDDYTLRLNNDDELVFYSEDWGDKWTVKLDFQQLNTVYEILKSKGYFNEN